MGYYAKHFKNKIILCNCDDPKQSNFYKFFKTKFKKLGLKKLISTHYQPSGLFEFSDAYMKEYDGKREKNIPLDQDGDFESPECVDLLKQADIVVTNPPFSKFRKFVALLVRHKKKFLIIGNFNATSYKEVFPLFQQNKIWLGMMPRGHTFIRPDGSENSVNSVWYTNLPNRKRTEEFVAAKKYAPETYPKYDNYDAIEVSKVKLIPNDYDGEMGVPITFLEKLNPSQFQLVGLSRYLSRDRGGKDFELNGKIVYMRVIIKWKELPK